MAVVFKMPKIGFIRLLGLLGAVVFFVVAATNLLSVKPGGSAVAVGEEARLHTGRPSTPLATTKDHYDEVQQALLAKDSGSLRQLIIQERAFFVDEGTRVQVVDMNWNLTMIQVKVSEGPQAGKVGWVANEYVVKD